MHSDGTGRRQVDILNLIINGMQEGDPSYLPILFLASILPEDGTANMLHESIIYFVEDKKELLEYWKRVTERNSPEYEYGIDLAGLDLTKL